MDAATQAAICCLALGDDRCTHPGAEAGKPPVHTIRVNGDYVTLEEAIQSGMVAIVSRGKSERPEGTKTRAPRPSFRRGLGGILDLGNGMFRFSYARDPVRADAQALRRDWKAVGRELARAIKVGRPR